jgi:glycerol-3-phosphate O-acyltransferase
MSKSNSNLVLSGLIVDGLKGFRKVLASFLCRRAELDDESIRIVKEYSEKGSVVFASFQSSNISLLMLYNLLNRNGLELPKIALEFNPYLLQTITYLFKRLLRRLTHPFGPRGFQFDSDSIKGELDENRPLIFSMLSDTYFLKRYMEQKYDTLYYLVELQRSYDKEIFIIPQTIFWTRRPSKSQLQNPDWKASADKPFFQALFSTMTQSYVHMIEPVSIKKLMNDSPTKTTSQLVHILREKLIELQHHEERVVLGPVLAPRHEMMERVLYHDNVTKQILHISSEEGIAEEKLKRKAYKLYKEIAADFSIKYIGILLHVLNWLFAKIFSGIKLSDTFLASIKESSRKGPVVLVPCHRSHMDYLILSYTFYINRIIPPHIAAGVNLSFFPMGTIFRHSGAFFIRRTFKNLKLYPVIFKQYLKTLVADQYQIEFFIEGGRTRTGRLLAPRPGLLSFLIEAVDEGYADDLTFVPISINYDRVLEENAYFHEMKGKAKKRETMGQVISGHKFLKKDYGFVYVNAGTPLSLKEMQESSKKDEEELVPYIGKRIMHEIADAVTISPVAFITLALLIQNRRGMGKSEIISTAQHLFEYGKKKGLDFAHVFEEKSIPDIFVSVITSYKADKIVEELEDEGIGEEIYHIVNDNSLLISFYKNTISHYFIPLFICSNVIIRTGSELLSREKLVSEYRSLYEFLSFEFVFEKRDDDFIKTQIELVVDNFLIPLGFVMPDTLRPIPESVGQKQLESFARGIEDIIEAYYIACDTILCMKKNKIHDTDLYIRIIEHANALELTDQISAVESVSVPVFKNAVKYLKENGVLKISSISKKKNRVEVTDKQKLKKITNTIHQYMVTVRR